MSAIVTLSERKQRELDRRQAAVRAIMAELKAYGAGVGRFVIFGSVARGEMRDDSDLDLLIDFPPEREREAIEKVEDLSSRYKIPIDFHLAPDIGERLRMRIDRDGREI